TTCPPGTWWRRGGKLDVLKKLPQAFRPSDCPAPPPLVRFPQPVVQGGGGMTTVATTSVVFQGCLGPVVAVSPASAGWGTWDTGAGREPDRWPDGAGDEPRAQGGG